MKFKPNYVYMALALVAASGLAGCSDDDTPTAQQTPDPVAAAVNDIQNVVVIYAENRSFDNLYSDFPGQSDALAAAVSSGKVALQVDRDGATKLSRIPAVRTGSNNGGVAANMTVADKSQFDASVGQITAATVDTALAGLGQVPFYSVNDTFSMGLNAVHQDMYHRFYENQMQIDGGKNDQFVAWADSGGMVMGLYTKNGPGNLPLWAVAQKYTMADHFFQGAFGGSFLNHQYLVASAAPVDPAGSANLYNATTNTGGLAPSVLTDGATGYKLTVCAAAGAGGKDATTGIANCPATGTFDASALNATPIFQSDTNLTPDGFLVNTMQPAYQPSSNSQIGGATGNDLLLANPATGNTAPPQTGDNIGDYLNKANVSWAWYGGGWGTMQACRVAAVGGAGCPSGAFDASGNAAAGGAFAAPGSPYINFQFHHQPFNYFKKFDPTTADGAANRTAHLKDAGDAGDKFIADIDAGKLPAVAFYKPVGYLNEHGGYANVTLGDQHIANVISHLEKSPQWKHMLVVVTYDENGGIWDHVAPPKGDRFGPGSRIPAIIAGPTVKTNFVDHTMYDTTSILRFITRRWSLPVLPGLQVRIDGLAKNAGAPQGDLSNVLKTSL